MSKESYRRNGDFGALAMAQKNIERVAESVQDAELKQQAADIAAQIARLDAVLRKHRGVKPKYIDS